MRCTRYIRLKLISLESRKREKKANGLLTEIYSTAWLGTRAVEQEVK